MIEIMNLKIDKPKFIYDFRVDRGSVFGNPYFMTKEEERDSVCDKYHTLFNDRINNPERNPYFMAALNQIINTYTLYGKLRLFCWCNPKRCHVETIKNYIEKVI